MEELEQETERLYDEYLMKEENRGISYGEILYIQHLKPANLKEFYRGLCEVMNGKEN